MKTAKIVYASLTGNTEQLTELLSDELKQNGVDVSVSSVDDASVEDFKDYDICIVATYTYGIGEIPDEFTDFHDDLEDLDLSGKTFGVVGTGDTAYGDSFCEAVTKFEEAFESTGAKRGAECVKIEFAPEEDEDIQAVKEFAKEIAK